MLTMREWQERAVEIVAAWLETLQTTDERGAPYASTAPSVP
jgi:hypothetical protein